MQIFRRSISLQEEPDENCGKLVFERPNRMCRASRTGLTRIEVVVIVVIALLGILMSGPWLLKQRSIARKRACSAKQYSVARAQILFADEPGHFAGFRNPTEASPFQFPVDDNEMHRGVSPVQATLVYLYSLSDDSELTKQRRLESLFKSQDGDFPKGEYYSDLISQQTERDSLSIPAIPELNCPDKGAVDYRSNPDASTTIFNCGMPDVAGDKFPTDWRANGLFLDLSDETKVPQTPNTLSYVDDHDGLSQTFLLSENVDAGGWLETNESRIGFVWLDIEDGKWNDKLYAINRQSGQREASSTDDYRFARPSSYHVGGVNVVYCDGSTQFLSERIDYVVYALMMSCDDTATLKPGTKDAVSSLYHRKPAKIDDSDKKVDTSDKAEPQTDHKSADGKVDQKIDQSPENLKTE